MVTYVVTAKWTAKPGERISLNGPRKDVATLAVAVRAGATVTLDDAGELEALRAAVVDAGRPARVHLRLRPDYARITASACSGVMPGFKRPSAQRKLPASRPPGSSG